MSLSFFPWRICCPPFSYTGSTVCHEARPTEVPSSGEVETWFHTSVGVHSAARVKVWRLRYLAPNRVLLVAAGASSDFPEAHEPLPHRTMGPSGSSSAQQEPSPPPAGEASHPEPQLCAPPSVPISMFRTLKWGLGPQPVPLPSPVPVSCA